MGDQRRKPQGLAAFVDTSCVDDEGTRLFLDVTLWDQLKDPPKPLWPSNMEKTDDGGQSDG